MYKKDVAADGRSCANNGFATENSRSRVNRHVVFDGWMAFSTFFDFAVLVFLKTTRTERDRVIKLNARADLRRLTDDYAGTVIDEKVFDPICAPGWMSIPVRL